MLQCLRLWGSVLGMISLFGMIQHASAAVCSEDRILKLYLTAESQGHQARTLMFVRVRQGDSDRTGEIGSIAGNTTVSESLLFDLSVSLAALVHSEDSIRGAVHSVLSGAGRLERLRDAQEAVARLRSSRASLDGFLSRQFVLDPDLETVFCSRSFQPNPIDVLSATRPVITDLFQLVMNQQSARLRTLQDVAPILNATIRAYKESLRRGATPGVSGAREAVFLSVLFERGFLDSNLSYL